MIFISLTSAAVRCDTAPRILSTSDSRWHTLRRQIASRLRPAMGGMSRHTICTTDQTLLGASRTL